MLAQDIFHHTILTSHVYLDLIDVFVAHVSILNLLFFILKELDTEHRQQLLQMAIQLPILRSESGQ